MKNELSIRIQSAVAHITDVMLVYLDREFNFVWVNPAYVASCRMRPEEIVGKNHFALYPDAENEAIFKTVRDTGEPVFFKDKPFQYLDQPERGVTYWDWSLTPEKDDDGTVNGLVFSLRETTPFKQTQLALKESEERFRSMAEISSDIIFRVDHNGKITYVSPALQTMGYTPGEVIDKHFAEFVSVEDRPKAQATFQQVIGGSKIDLIELKLLKADNSVMETEISVIPIVRGQRVVGVQGMARDVTERLRAEETIRSLARFPSENPFPVIRVNRDGGILYANKASAPLLAVWGVGIGDLLPEEHRRLIAQTIESQTIKGMEQRCGDRLLSLKLTPIPGTDFVNLYGVDITERQKAEREIKKLNRELRHNLAQLARANKNLNRSNVDLESFSSIISHDLREPLRTISGFAQLLTRRYGEELDEKGRTFIQHIVEGTKHMDRQLNDLLAFSRAGGGRLAQKSLDLTHLVKEVARKLDGTIKKTGAEIQCSDLPVVIADEMQLFILFQNLICNSMKYCDKVPPRIHILGQTRKNAWLICVRDNGIGIDSKHAEHIFKIFQRLHLRHEYEGTGIGLAICKRIVERHGGRIWVESTPGQGASFNFTLPMQEGIGNDE